MNMRFYRKKSCIIIYLLFIAIFKSYFLPTIVQQGLKISIIAYCLIFIATKVKPRQWINISLIYAGITLLCSFVAYRSNYLSRSTMMDSVFYSVCIYCVYSVIRCLCNRGLGKDVVRSILDISGIYAILTFVSLFMPLYTDDSGSVVYLFGNKFLSSYYMMLFAITYYSYNVDKIRKLFSYKLTYFFICIISLVFAVVSQCSTAALATALIVLSMFVPEKIKELLKSPLIISLSMIVSAMFPIFMSVIMNNSFVKYLVVNILHESTNLNYRNVIYSNHIFQLIENSPLWGYGYNNTMMLDRTNQVFSNAQNALLEITVRFGVIGAAALIITVALCFIKATRNHIVDGYILFTYILVIIGTIEVSYGWCFFFTIFMIKSVSENSNNNVRNSNALSLLE